MKIEKLLREVKIKVIQRVIVKIKILFKKKKKHSSDVCLKYIYK